MTALDEVQSVAGRNQSGFDDAIVPAGAAGLLKAPRHVGQVEAAVQFPAGLPALAHFQKGAAEAKPISDRDIALRQPQGREIFAEGARLF
ncbi:hypothetical protein D9M70_632390 [compost metagenome]